MSTIIRWCFGAAVVIFLAASTAQAKTVSVTCGSAKIADALKTLDPAESNVIRVNGMCNEFVSITDFIQLSIVGSSKGTAGIQGSGSGLWIVRSHVQLRNLTVRGGLWGVMCREFSVCTFSGNTIENTTGRGVELDGADATFNGDIIRQNANAGLFLTSSRAYLTDVQIRDTQAGEWNPGNGIDMDKSSLVVEGLTVDGNAGSGVSMSNNSSLTNRPWSGTFSATNNLSGGIWVTGGSTASLGGVVVTGNKVRSDGTGTGIVITGNATVSFWTGGNVTDNQPMDMYCSVNGYAVGLTGVTVGNSNCVDPYQ